MLSKIWDLLVGQFCKHEYKILREGNITDECNENIGHYYIQRCIKCGKITTYTIRA